MPNVPPLAERQKPGLSQTLPPALNWHTCQACGAAQHADDARILRWKECDEWDQELHPVVYVILCERCSARLLEPHPRLYLPVEPGDPVPGTMAICGDCPHLVLPFTCPLARSQGGAGVWVMFDRPPSVMFVDGVRNGRRTGWRRIDYGTPVGCYQKDGHPAGTRPAPKPEAADGN